jgi:hypothetical protein
MINWEWPNNLKLLMQPRNPPMGHGDINFMVRAVGYLHEVRQTELGTSEGWVWYLGLALYVAGISVLDWIRGLVAGMVEG